MSNISENELHLSYGETSNSVLNMCFLAVLHTAISTLWSIHILRLRNFTREPSNRLLGVWNLVNVGKVANILMVYSWTTRIGVWLGLHTYHMKQCFAKKFCQVRWVENVDVAELANVKKFIEGTKKLLTNITCTTDQKLCWKTYYSEIAFFSSVGAQYEPFLNKYRTQVPVPFTPFLYQDLSHLGVLRVLMMRLLRSQFWSWQIVLLSSWKLMCPVRLSDIITKRWMSALVPSSIASTEILA